MEYTRLGRTGLSVNRTSFGALPIQRIPSESTAILRAAYEAGIEISTIPPTPIPIANLARSGPGRCPPEYHHRHQNRPPARRSCSSTWSKTPKMLRTDYIDIHQLHCAPRVYRPRREDGVYDWLLQREKEGCHPPYFCHRPPHRRRGGSPGKRSLRYPAISLLGHRR